MGCNSAFRSDPLLDTTQSYILNKKYFTKTGAMEIYETWPKSPFWALYVQVDRLEPKGDILGMVCMVLYCIQLYGIACYFIVLHGTASVSYTHLTLPTNREV